MVMGTEVVYFCFADFDVMGVSYTTSSILDFKLSHFVNHFVWGALYSGQNWRPFLSCMGGLNPRIWFWQKLILQASSREHFICWELHLRVHLVNRLPKMTKSAESIQSSSNTNFGSGSCTLQNTVDKSAQDCEAICNWLTLTDRVLWIVWNNSNEWENVICLNYDMNLWMNGKFSIKTSYPLTIASHLM